MGFRFQRKVKLLPGVHANLSKGGVSMSAGPRGLKTTVGPRGVRTSVGLPGTGMRYEKTWTSPTNGTRPDKSMPPQNNSKSLCPMGKTGMNIPNSVLEGCKSYRILMVFFRIFYIGAILALFGFLVFNYADFSLEGFYHRVGFLIVASCICDFIDSCGMLAIAKRENEE